MNFRELILEQPSYWVESINGILYDAIIQYKEDQKFNRTQLADDLGISKGRISQILNDGETNFTIEKFCEIALKVGVFPDVKLTPKAIFIENENILKKENCFELKFDYYTGNFKPQYVNHIESTTIEAQVIQLKPKSKENYILKAAL